MVNPIILDACRVGQICRFEWGLLWFESPKTIDPLGIHTFDTRLTDNETSIKSVPENETLLTSSQIFPQQSSGVGSGRTSRGLY